MDKKIMYGLGSLALLVAVLAGVIAANYVANKSFSRIDLTESKQYTLSQSTKDILANLENPVRIKAIYSGNIPSPKNRDVQEIKDLLHEYETYGRGKVELEMIDPLGDTEMQEDLKKIGVNDYEMHVIDVDQAGAIRVYASISVAYLDKREILNGVHEIRTLEYDLTTTIDKMTSERETKVGFYNIDQRGTLVKEFDVLRQVLEKEFTVEDVNTSGGEPVPEDIQVLLVIRPEMMTERDLFAIDQYIMRGGAAIFLVDGVNLFFQQNSYGNPIPMDYAMPMNREDKIGELLTHYGVTRQYNLVMDKLHGNYPVAGPFGVEYPLFPIAIFKGDQKPEGVESHPITQGLDHVIFTWTSELTLAGKLPDGIKAVRLAQTSPESWVQGGQGGNFMLNPMKEPMPPLPVEGMGPGTRDLAVLLTGNFPSYFEGKPVPPVIEGDTAGPVQEVDGRLDKSKETSIMVVGGSIFVSNRNPLLQNSPNGLSMIVSATEWMMGGNKMADIRNRQSASRPFQLDQKKILIAGLIAPLAGPIFVIAFGITRFVYRSGQKRKFLEGV